MQMKSHTELRNWKISSTVSKDKRLVKFILILLNATATVGLNVYTEPPAILQPSKTAVIVSCYSHPASNVKILWEYDNKPIPFYPASGRRKKGGPDTYVLSNNSLYITQLRKRYTGEYTCIASSGAVRIQAKTTIRVSFLQQFHSIPDVRAFEGSPEARIDCPAPRGVPAPEVYWWRDGALLNSTVPMVNGKGSTLVFRDVKSSHAGTYTCFAKNKFKMRNVTASLKVVIPGDVIVKPKDKTIFENSDAEFNCKSKSIPPLPVQWKRLTRSCKTCRFTDQSVKVNARVRLQAGKLIFKNAEPTDKGRFKCVAGLNSEFVSKNVTLNVVELMKIDEKLHKFVQTINIRNSKKAKLTCQFRGDGKIEQVTWGKKNTTRLPSNMKSEMTTLEIDTPQISDAGNYTCTAKGEFNMFTGHVELKVYKSPVFKLRPSNVTGFAGDPAWVHCQGEGTPIPSVNYLKRPLKNKHQSILNESRFQMLKNHTLYIKVLEKGDNGIYFCWLTQQYASASVISEFHITVRKRSKESESATPMGRTVGIAVGCAGVYILLVIGLMIYCRTRRARLLRRGLLTEAEDGECLKDPLVGNEAIPLQNEKFLEQWEFPREDLKDHVLLGRGKMGRIFSARMTWDGNDLVVVKEFDGKVEEYKGDFNLEVEMFSLLNHDNIVRLIGVTTDSHPYYIITEYSECGDLKQHITTSTNLPNTFRLKMSASIASGMDYLIQLHYIHRDLACRNCIPYPNHTVKVSFLSICEDLYHDDYYLLNDIAVPLRWLSPEAIKEEAYSEKSDVWSFGVTMWEIFSSGATPYHDVNNSEVAEGVCKCLRLERPSGCPFSVYEVMQQCWLADVKHRPTFQQLTDMLNGIKLR